ncbi:MAG: alkaline phosphatase family protein, partial [Actinomycetia bacterium]|nr:alkaline phosphatase family protein [Actinomycetes bacterium]
MGVFNVFKKRNKVFVVGVDGFPHSLLNELISNGTMKKTGAMLAQGKLNKMSTSIPEISSVAWSTFMTGVNPALHNIFGFIDLEPGTYNMRFPNYSDLRGETIWEALKKIKKSSLIINQPATYPVKEVFGLMISGFVAISLEKSVYPGEYLKMIKENNYEIDIDTAKGREDHDYLFKSLNSSLDARLKTGLKLYKDIKPDFFEFIITGTDRLQHFRWNAIGDENNKYHKEAVAYYSKIDDTIAELYSMCDEKTLFILLSDHGFTKLHREVYINRFLEMSGYLSFDGDQKLTNINKSTRA